VFQWTAHGWDELPEEYRSSPYFTLDFELLAMDGRIAEQLDTTSLTGEMAEDGQLNDLVESLMSCSTTAPFDSYEYLCTDVSAVKELQNSLEIALNCFRRAIPHEGGLALELSHSGNLPIKRTRHKRRSNEQCRAPQQLHVVAGEQFEASQVMVELPVQSSVANGVVAVDHTATSDATKSHENDSINNSSACIISTLLQTVDVTQLNEELKVEVMRESNNEVPIQSHVVVVEHIEASEVMTDMQIQSISASGRLCLTCYSNPIASENYAVAVANE
jgi:hypothetical protein